MGIEDKNGTILNLDRQLREKNQLAEQVKFRRNRFMIPIDFCFDSQLQFNLQRTIRQTENQQMTNEKTIQSLKVKVN